MRKTLFIAALPIALVLATLVGGHVSADSPIVDRFVCKYSGLEWTFSEEGSRVLVRFDADSTLEERSEATRRAGLAEVHSSDNAVDVGVYQSASGVSARRASDRLADESIVVDARPLLLDNEGFPQYTIAGQMTVQFVPGLEAVECERIIADFGSQIVKKNRTPGYYTITLPESTGLYAAIRAMNENDLVWFSEESMMGFDDALYVPNDPSYGAQWHLDNTGQTGGVSGADVDAEAAWDITLGDPNVVIVIIDTGVDQDHPDLVGKLVPRNGEDWNFAEGANTDPDDTSGHGTACAGLSAADTDNGQGVAGTCADCRLIGLRINLSSGQNDNRADAINYAVSYQAANPNLRLVLSNSWRMSSGSFAAVEAACQNAFDNDVPILVASGNGNGAVDYPARYASTLAIGASSPCDERKNPGSCDGEGWGSNFGPELDVVAPGVIMTTTSIGGGYTGSFNGTSSACPTAAGVVGLILSVNPNLTYQEVENILEQSADDQVGPANEDPPGWDQWMGWGRVNAHQAVLDTPLPAPPIVNSVSPDSVRVNLGEPVTITGANFTGTSIVRFDGVPATSVTLINSTTLIAGAPANDKIESVDVSVETPSGSDTLVDGLAYHGAIFGPGNANAGAEISVLIHGPPNGDFGVVYDYFPGSKVRKGLTWPINFTPNVWGIAKDSFRTSDPPLTSGGQGAARYMIPDTPKLPSMTLYFVAVFDANGPDPSRPLVLAIEPAIVDIN